MLNAVLGYLGALNFTPTVAKRDSDISDGRSGYVLNTVIAPVGQISVAVAVKRVEHRVWIGGLDLGDGGAVLSVSQGRWLLTAGFRPRSLQLSAFEAKKQNRLHILNGGLEWHRPMGEASPQLGVSEHQGWRSML